LFGEAQMGRQIISRSAVEAEAARRSAHLLNTSTYGSWVASKVSVLPATVAGLVARILRKSPPAEPDQAPTPRRHAGVYMWRPTFRPDGMPDSYGEIVPIDKPNKPVS
jgi:hypothetical protein